jgi:flagellar biosynthesis protein FliR
MVLNIPEAERGDILCRCTKAVFKVQSSLYSNVTRILVNLSSYFYAAWSIISPLFVFLMAGCLSVGVISRLSPQSF